MIMMMIIIIIKLRVVAQEKVTLKILHYHSRSSRCQWCQAPQSVWSSWSSPCWRCQWRLVLRSGSPWVPPSSSLFSPSMDSSPIIMIIIIIMRIITHMKKVISEDIVKDPSSCIGNPLSWSLSESSTHHTQSTLALSWSSSLTWRKWSAKTWSEFHPLRSGCSIWAPRQYHFGLIDGYDDDFNDDDNDDHW